MNLLQSCLCKFLCWVTTKSSCSDRDWETEFEEAKAEVSKDTFTTMEEARDRAEELGCSGTHTHDDEGRLVYMPCATHEEYEKRLAEENGDT